jgi:chaperonin GroES
MKLRHDFILVELFEEAKVSKGGVLLPTIAPTPFREGKVLAAGPGTWYNGTLVEVDVIPGDVVTFHNGAGATYKDGNRLLKYSDVIQVDEVRV